MQPEEPKRLKTPAADKHYKPEEVAEMWGVSLPTVRRLFQDRPGVLHIAGTKASRDRIRIPQSVLEMVHRERSGR